MHINKKSVLLVSMPFAGVAIPSIQLQILEGFCRERDIHIETKHLYLKAAEIYGLQHYNYLICPPNDSYTAQNIFSKYVFPDHWKNNQEKFKDFFNQRAALNKEKQMFSFEDYVQQTDIFFQWVLENLNWRSFDIIGFTLNYGQLLPSLAIAKNIKALAPEKSIIFGGSRTVDKLGMNVLRAFDYVDFIVSGDGEEALFQLASDFEHVASIPRLIYRKNGKIHWNQSEAVVNLNSTPIPSYDSFYRDLAATTGEIQQYFHYFGRLPVEISRGCWWNRCTFCNLNVHYPSYQEKSVGRIIQEIQWLSDRYRMLEFQMIGNTLPRHEYRSLFEKIKQLGRDFSFFVEARAGQLTGEDYRLMKEAGFTAIQTGVESFSSHYLRKINKGVRVIDNIAALKFCQENKIKNGFNLLVRYPNEEPVDFEETSKVVHIIQSFLDPPQLCEFRLMYGSPIYCHPQSFNIETITNTSVDTIMFPPHILEQGCAFVYGFKRAIQYDDHNWESLVENWRKEREAYILEGAQNQTVLDQLVFYFVDGGSFLKIYDKRDRQNVRIFNLNALERAVFLACVDIISLKKLQQKFTDVPEFELIAMLQSFEQNSLIFVEDDHYLSLPLQYNIRATLEKKVEHTIDITL